MDQLKRQELLFDLNQSKPRALIRIKEDRAGPQDVMIANVFACLDGMYRYEVESLGYKISDKIVDISALSGKELIQLQKDLEYLRLDDSTFEFWDMMGTLIAKEIEKRSIFARSNDGILQDLETMISKKSLQELKMLQEEIILKIKAGGVIDFDYWEMALKFLQVVLAEKDVQQVYEGFCMKCSKGHDESNLTSLTFPVIQSMQLKTVSDPGKKDKSFKSNLKESKHRIQKFKHVPKEFKHLSIVKEGDFKIMLGKMVNENSLKFIHPKLEGEGGIVERKVKSELEEKREKQFHRDSGLEMTPEETVFKKEEVFLPCSPNIDITHRLRKPRYHNSIKTIVEWSKYNSTHYNEFNLPPRVVDGYKFNLYYPDLLDKSKPPNYQISPDVTEETRILRFSAGKPYADIAFRIVNKPWDVCHRRGFRVDFENGHLRLYFGFKKDPFSQI